MLGAVRDGFVVTGLRRAGGLLGVVSRYWFPYDPTLVSDDTTLVVGWLGSVVLLSVSSGDRQSLPTLETLEVMQGYTLLRTDRNGWIDPTMDGAQLWVEVEKRR